MIMELRLTAQPQIKTSLPGPEAAKVLEAAQRYVARGISLAVPSVARRAEGAIIEDLDGNRFIDFVGGIGVLNVGSVHPKVSAAIHQQVDRYLHTCVNVFPHQPYVDLCRRLVEITPGDWPKKAALFNAGVEAVENAVKIARKYTGRSAVLTFENAFHGRTLLGMSLTSKVMPYKLGFGPFASEVYKAVSPYCYRCPTGKGAPDCELACLAMVERTVDIDIGADQLAAVIVEPVQGEGGFIPLPEGYLQGLQRICAERGVILIVDEIQTGFGRTGHLLACEHYGVAPDIILMAKSLAAGLPLSAVVGRAEVMDATHPGGIGGTYSGNPVACAAALAVLEVMESEGLSERAGRIGRQMTSRLRALAQRLPGMGDVRGLGAMVAVELVRPDTDREPATDETNKVIQYCYQHGLVVLKAGIHDNCIRALPPLVITDEQLDAALTIWEQGLLEVLPG